MISYFTWLHGSKNDKLDVLKSAVEELERRQAAADARHTRLLAYYGLVEIDGPRIVEKS